MFEYQLDILEKLLSEVERAKFDVIVLDEKNMFYA